MVSCDASSAQRYVRRQSASQRFGTVVFALRVA
jgi:hypothetical protein